MLSCRTVPLECSFQTVPPRYCLLQISWPPGSPSPASRLCPLHASWPLRTGALSCQEKGMSPRFPNHRNHGLAIQKRGQYKSHAGCMAFRDEACPSLQAKYEEMQFFSSYREKVWGQDKNLMILILNPESKMQENFLEKVRDHQP